MTTRSRRSLGLLASRQGPQRQRATPRDEGRDEWPGMEAATTGIVAGGLVDLSFETTS